MADLIDREALLVALDYGRTRNLGVRQIVSAAPSVDVVPVVRCKDCIYKGGYDCPLEYAIQWGIGNVSPGDDDYCSEGQRMDADAPERAEGGGT